jgi:hypothetical protein
MQRHMQAQHTSAQAGFWRHASAAQAGLRRHATAQRRQGFGAMPAQRRQGFGAMPAQRKQGFGASTAQAQHRRNPAAAAASPLLASCCKAVYWCVCLWAWLLRGVQIAPRLRVLLSAWRVGLCALVWLIDATAGPCCRQ